VYIAKMAKLVANPEPLPVSNSETPHHGLVAEVWTVTTEKPDWVTVACWPLATVAEAKLIEELAAPVPNLRVMLVPELSWAITIT
jgi:hypothetical protein